MKIAVVSLTRDRLDLTKHCFAALRANAGCEYDHFVWDNGSTDGTVEWLDEWVETPPTTTKSVLGNIGISRAMNELLRIVEQESSDDPYDVIVKFDNDCELLTPNTLRDVCDLVHRYGLILSPTIHGLRNTPRTLGTPLSLGGALVDEKAQIGGVFLAAPADLYDEFRYSESNPKWGGDDVEVCAWWRSQGGKCGYVRGYAANHATDQQQEMYPAYFERKHAEMSA